MPTSEYKMKFIVGQGNLTSKFDQNYRKLCSKKVCSGAILGYCLWEMWVVLLALVSWCWDLGVCSEFQACAFVHTFGQTIVLGMHKDLLLNFALVYIILSIIYSTFLVGFWQVFWGWGFVFEFILRKQNCIWLVVGTVDVFT